MATVFNTFSTRLYFLNEKCWECKSEISRKSLFGLSLFITAEKNCCLWRSFPSFSFLFQELTDNVFWASLHFSAILLWLLCHENRICRKSSGKVEIDLDRISTSVFRWKHHFLNFILQWFQTFARKTSTKVGWVDFISLFESSFPSSHCFVHQIFSCQRMSTTTVFDVVLKSKNTSQMNQQFAVKFSLFWNWLLDCWTFAQKNVITVRTSEIHFFDVSFQQNGFFQETLLLANVKLTLHCCHCAVRARPRRQYLMSIVFEYWNSKLLTSIFWTRSSFSESLFFTFMPNLRPIVL